MHANPAGQSGRIDPQAHRASMPRSTAWVVCAAFGLYWLSSFVLEARDAARSFGADTWHYSELAQGNVFGRIAGNYYLERITRFHPVTVVLAAAWMKLLAPLTVWIDPHHLLRGLFAAVGAVGVWAAMSAFAATLSRRYVVLFGIIYAISFDIWYFSSIEESKIVTASLSALYIAGYLRLRERWSKLGAATLTAILLLACLNEIVSGLLIVIPAVDTLVRRGWDWREGSWIAVHGLAGPVALVILEGVIQGRLSTLPHAEGTSHFSLLLFYIAKGDHSFASLYSFAANWLFFNIVAPTPNAPLWANLSPEYGGYFEPVLANYLASPVSVGLVVLFGVMIVAAALPRYRSESLGRNTTGILLALTAYALARALFFFIFNPSEPLLFSPAVALAHLLIIGIPFAVSGLPAKPMLLSVLAALLLITNGAFIFAK